MNILLIKHFCVGFMVTEIPIVSVFGYFPLFRPIRKVEVILDILRNTI